MYIELDCFHHSQVCPPFCTCQVNWRVTTEPSCSKNSSGHGNISAALKLLKHHVSLCFTTKASAKKQKCYNVRCKHISRCFKFNQFRWSSEHSVVDAFESLRLYELLSDSHFPCLKVAGLSVSLFTPVEACWKYQCQKQEIRDVQILQSEALVRSLHSSHILTSKPSKSKCQKKTVPNDDVDMQNPTTSFRSKIRQSHSPTRKLERWCWLYSSAWKTAVATWGLPKVSYLRNAAAMQIGIYTVQTIPQCHGGDSAKLTQQSYHSKILGKQENTVFFQCFILNTKTNSISLERTTFQVNDDAPAWISEVKSPARCNGSLFDVVLGRGSIATAELELKTNRSTVDGIDMLPFTLKPFHWINIPSCFSASWSKLKSCNKAWAKYPNTKCWPLHQQNDQFKHSAPHPNGSSLNVCLARLQPVFTSLQTEWHHFKIKDRHHLASYRTTRSTICSDEGRCLMTFFMDLGLGLSWTKPTWI